MGNTAKNQGSGVHSSDSIQSHCSKYQPTGSGQQKLYLATIMSQKHNTAQQKSPFCHQAGDCLCHVSPYQTFCLNLKEEAHKVTQAIGCLETDGLMFLEIPGVWEL